jgi:hypothetical protein
MRYGQMKETDFNRNSESLNQTQFKEFSYSEFFSQISKEKVFLEQVHKPDKYSRESGKSFIE